MIIRIEKRGTVSHRCLLGMAGAAAVVLAGGCASAEEQSSGKGWAAEFDRAVAASSSEFVREVLSDGVIETQEIREARAGMLQCMRDAGVTVDSWGDDETWGLTYAGEATPEMLDVELECDTAWIGPLSNLYRQVALNPDNDDWDSLVAGCFVRNGLAPEGYSGQDYRELEGRGIAGAQGDDANTLDDAIAAADDAPPVERRLPGGVDLGEGKAWDCRMDPRS